MTSSPVTEIQNRLQLLADPVIAEHSQRFFKTGPGGYGAGDRFLGIRVPVLRGLARQFRSISLEQAEMLLQSPWHESRLLALLILVLQYQKGDAEHRKGIYELYCENMRFVNNWDLVDSSAHFLVGDYLRTRSRKPLHRWAKSEDLWERRIAIIATFAEIRAGEFDETLAIAELLLHDSEDLIHKAVGWMLREVGNRDHDTLIAFLLPRYTQMLRYAIEKFPSDLRKQYLKGEV